MPTLETEDCGCVYVDNGMYYMLRSACPEHKESASGQVPDQGETRSPHLPTH